MTSIGASAFVYCGNLASVTIPSTVTSVGDAAFEYCTSLTQITVDTNNPTYSSSPDGVMFNKTQTTLVVYPTGRSGPYVIPASVTGIANSAFESCYNLTAVTIPNGVTSIGGTAFAMCNSLTNVSIPASVTSIGFFAFLWSWDLAAITVDGANPAYSSIGGVLFDKAQTTLIYCPRSAPGPTYVIPSSVQTISSYAFYQCGFTGVTIPGSVTTIQTQAFDVCNGLTRVDIPASVTSISYAAFADESNVTAVYLYSAIPATLSGAAFDNQAAGRIIYVPTANVVAYQAAWSAYESSIQGY